MRSLIALAAAGLALAPTAAGHGPEGGAVGYVSTAAGLKPQVLGVSVRVLGGDDRLRLANYSGKTVFVLGYEREPFLRFTPSGVYENVRSPATYLSRARDPAQAHVPASADAEATPRWRMVAKGQSFEWHDHRIHWTESEPPAAVQKAPDEVHLIFRWAVPALADGKPFAVSGFLGYVPPPVESGDGGGTSGWLLAAAIGAALLAAIAIAIGTGARRARHRTP